MDSKESMQTFSLTDGTETFDPKEVPPGIKDMVQIQNLLACAVGFDYQPGALQFWDLMTGRDLNLLENAHANEIRALCTLRRTHLVSGSIDCTVKIWDVTTYECFHQLILPDG